MTGFFSRFLIFFIPLIGASLGFAQPVLHLKTRRIATQPRTPIERLDRLGHLVLQFESPPTADTLAVLAERGVKVVADVPENGLLVTLDRPASLRGLGVRYAAPLDPADKISPLVGGPEGADGYFLVELHPDADINDARGLILRQGVELKDNPDLIPRQLMIYLGDPVKAVAALAALAADDAVAYIFPASRELIRGIPVRGCGGGLTPAGPVAQYIATNGAGWDGPGLNAATISYVFSKLSDHTAAGATQSAILSAMAEWAKVVKVTWQQGSDPLGKRTVNILFARGDHGDGYPFTGGVLAHTFYPAPPNPEPIAGDMHFDDAESWNFGVNTDVFSVALHELGHALGLGHSDNPADVMYPYYKMASTLAAGDKAAVLTLYAAQDARTPTPPANPAPPAPAPAPPAPAPPSPAPPSPAPPSPAPPSPAPPSPAPPSPAPPSPPAGKDSTPPTLTIVSPGGSTVSTSASSIQFSGTASDNVGVASVTWTTNTGQSGTAKGTTQWSATIPLLTGFNTVTIHAADAAGNTTWRGVVVSRY